MPLTRRYAVVVALAALLAGGVLLHPEPAGAGQTPTVTFHGGCGYSTPDAPALSVPVEGLVVFVNHLGTAATLLVDGRPAGTLHANDQVSVVFHHGPVAVTLVPACRSATTAQPVRVTVGAQFPAVAASPSPDSLYVAAQPPAARQDAPAAPHRRGVSKILVLVAAICVVGVSFATIRAIISQRAIRTASA
jgi:hypothetical protein